MIRALVNEVPLGTQSNVLPDIERGLSTFTRIYAAQQGPTSRAPSSTPGSTSRWAITLNSCLRIALERPRELDEDHLIDAAGWSTVARRWGACRAGASLISQSTAPLVTVAPTSAVSPVTVPALCALSGCSIFIASSTTITSPSATVCALLDGDLDDRALHRAGHRVAGRGGTGLLAGRPLRLLGAAGRAAGRPPPRPAGQHDLEPLAADLDGDRLPLPGLRRPRPTSPAYGGIWLSNSVSIHCV